MFVKFKIMIMLSLFFNQQYKVKQILIFTTNVQTFSYYYSYKKHCRIICFFQDQLIRGFVNNNLEMFVGDLRGS